MDPVFLLFVAFFLLPMVLKFLRKASPTETPRSKTNSKPMTLNSRLDSQRQMGSSPWDKAEFRDLRKTLQVMGQTQSTPKSSRSNASHQAQRKTDYEARQKQMKRNAAKRAKRLKAHDASHEISVEVKDRHDNNRHRRADWGQRAGPGMLNSQTFLIALVTGLIAIYLLGQT